MRDVQETNSLNHSIPQRVCAQANAEKKNSKTSNLPRSLPGEIEREWKDSRRVFIGANT